MMKISQYTNNAAQITVILFNDDNVFIHKVKHIVIQFLLSRLINSLLIDYEFYELEFYFYLFLCSLLTTLY